MCPQHNPAARPRQRPEHALLRMVGAEVLVAVMRVTTRFGARGLAWQEVAMVRFLDGALVVWWLQGCAACRCA